MKSKVYIVLLNYNGWKDTIECLESILKNDYPNYQIIVVDNNSTDDSMNNMINWAKGRQEVIYPENTKLKHLSQPFVKKPLDYILYTKTESESGGDLKQEEQFRNPIIFIQAGENRGFAAGNNIAISYALKKNDFEYVWLLNNDTVIPQNALTNLVTEANKKNFGLCGSILMYYNEPQKMQCCGSYINKFFAMPRVILDPEKIEDKLEYIVGASFLIRKEVIDKIGLLPEEYFMYFEETDYCFTARAKSFNISVATDSIVYHKEGAAMKEKDSNGSALADYLALRNKIIFAKKHLPIYLVFVYLSFIGVLINRIRRRNLLGVLKQRKKIEHLMNTKHNRILNNHENLKA